MDKAKFEKLRKLRESIDLAEEDLKAMKRERKELEASLVEDMVMSGFESVKMNGKSYRPSSKIFVNKIGGTNTDDICAALTGGELPEFVNMTYNANGLKAFVAERLKKLRESDPGADPSSAIPEGLRDFFNVYEEPTISMTTVK